MESAMVGISLLSSREGSEPMTRLVTLTPVNLGDRVCGDPRPACASPRHTRT